MQQSEEKKRKISIEDEMRGAYLDYAMSVIIGRALPDVRDGLKPVHRRILFAMNELGNRANQAYKKSARVVGDVIGKYHPHGDSAVYDAMVRMAQDFSMRYVLVDGQGNFGSVDGDPAAAMRYTEVRMHKMAEALLQDLDEETVDFGLNYDETLKEPRVLPTRFPQLIVNGASGIAVGMATQIPPHHLGEVMDAILALIDEPLLSSRDLMKYVKGPDFPTGGLIYCGDGLLRAYETGRGSVKVRARTEIELFKNDRERIIVTELPFQVNKARLIEKIADLAKEKKIEGISDLRDESDRSGMRIVIEVKKGESAQVLLNQLYKLTPLQDSFSFNMLAIDQGQPKMMGLRELCVRFMEHRREVIRRRSEYRLRKNEAKLHILEGLKKALEHIEAVIKCIRSHKAVEEAAQALQTQFELSPLQAKSILEMRLQRLTMLEREKILEDRQKTLQAIEALRRILNEEEALVTVLREECLSVQAHFKDERRSELIHEAITEFEVADLIANDETLVAITRLGFVKRTDPSVFREQHRGGRGLKGMSTSDEDFVRDLFYTKMLSTLVCVTNFGRAYSIPVYKLPESGRTQKGKAIVNFIQLQSKEQIRAIVPVEDFESELTLVLATRQGLIKRMNLKDFKAIRQNGLSAITILDGDDLIGAKLAHDADDVFLFSRQGMSIRFRMLDVRATGRTSRGVTGIQLAPQDEVLSIEVISAGSKAKEILSVSDSGFGRRTPIEDYRLQTRAGVGVRNLRANEKKGLLVGALAVAPDDSCMLITNKGQMIRLRIAEISGQSRYGSGVKLITTEGDERVVAMETFADSEPQ
jgi:DNA gyrase subunit A